VKPGADADDERRENRRGDPTVDVDVGTLCEWIKFVIENTFCQYGNAVYHQILGFPMRTNCGVELADTYLFSYEYAYLLRQLRLLPGIVSLPLQLVVVLYSKRFIDDILSLDLDAFETGDVFYDDRGTGGTDGIYPRSLSGPNGLIDMSLALSKPTKNNRDTSVDFLDMTITVDPSTRTLQWRHYDKRRGNPQYAGTRPYPSLLSKLPHRCKVVTLTSAMHRFGRGTLSANDFVVNTIRLASSMIDNGYKRPELFSEIWRFSAFSPWKGKWSHVLMKILRSLRRRAHSSSA